MEDIQEGRCQCGDISYSLKKSKIISTHHCHCKDCQRTTGSGKATIIFIAKKYVDLNKIITKAIKRYTKDVRNNTFPKKNNFLNVTRFR